MFKKWQNRNQEEQEESEARATEEVNEKEPMYPVLIIPGLCSSGLKVEAGYDKWLQKRIWLSVRRMGSERLRVTSTEKLKRSFFDPTAPPITSGFVYIREGSILNRQWNRSFFTFNVEKKILLCFPETCTEEHPLSEFQPVNSIPKVTIRSGSVPSYKYSFTKNSVACLIKKSPRWTAFDFSIELSTRTQKLVFCADSEENTLLRLKQFVMLIEQMFPNSKLYRASSQSIIGEGASGSPSPKSSPGATPSRNLWLDHLNLMEDGFSDPPGIRVRAIEGLEAVTYLDPNPLVRSASYVFAPVIERLQSIGYTDTFLKALPYDWRLPPFALQQRDSFFTVFKNTVEEMVGTTGKPVIILAHSMGNKVTHYFLQYILYTLSDGMQWIFRHIHLYFALGAPWLGAPKAVRGLCVGDKMGLDAFISTEEALKMSRRMGSTAWLFPELPELHFKDPNQNFAMIKENGVLEYKDIDEILKEAGAEGVWNCYETYYQHDPQCGKGKTLTAPPVPWLLCVYGINIDTEIGFIATRKPQKGSNLSADKTALHDTFLCKGGILYETSESEQKILEDYSPEEDPHRSGDGTVPYASLRYAECWKQSGFNVDIVEIPDAGHREILEHPQFLQILENCAIGKKNPEKTINLVDESVPSYLQGLSFTQLGPNLSTK